MTLKICPECNIEFGPLIHPTGQTESNHSFGRRTYCSEACKRSSDNTRHRLRRRAQKAGSIDVEEVSLPSDQFGYGGVPRPVTKAIAAFLKRDIPLTERERELYKGAKPSCSVEQRKPDDKISRRKCDGRQCVQMCKASGRPEWQCRCKAIKGLDYCRAHARDRGLL